MLTVTFLFKGSTCRAKLFQLIRIDTHSYDDSMPGAKMNWQNITLKLDIAGLINTAKLVSTNGLAPLSFSATFKELQSVTTLVLAPFQLRGHSLISTASNKTTHLAY